MREIKKLVNNKTVTELVYFVDEATPDFLVEWFNDWLEPYVNDRDALASTEYLQLGFSYLKIINKAGRLQLQAPDFVQFPIQWVDDLYPALHVVTQHKFIPQSYELEMDLPSMYDTAIVGEKFEKYPLFLTRSEKVSSSDHSGWFIASLDESVDNADEGKLMIMSLYEAITIAPHIVSYLSMPEESQIVFEEVHPVIMHRNRVLQAGSDSFVKIAMNKNYQNSSLLSS